MAASNKIAQSFKALHQPGKPLVLTNVFDQLSARAVASLPECRALATASYGVARANNMEDDDMDMETNLAAAQVIAQVARDAGKPLTVDVQDGYGDQLEETITRVIKLGAVGVNLEDYDKEKKELYSNEAAADRIKRALSVAGGLGLPDFAINARTDALLHGGDVNDAISRGKAYLAAGANTVFVWGGGRGTRTEEVAQLVEAFGGRLNVSLKMTSEGLKIPELAKIGVARISIGPALQRLAVQLYKDKAAELLGMAAP